MNLYRFVGNAPTYVTDPLGLQKGPGIEVGKANGKPIKENGADTPNRNNTVPPKPIKSQGEKDEERFREAAKRCGVSDADLDLLLNTAKTTPKPNRIPGTGSHKICFKWAVSFQERLTEALRKRDYLVPPKAKGDTSIHGVTHYMLRIFDVPFGAQGNTAQDISFKDKLIPYTLDSLTAPPRSDISRDPDEIKKMMLAQDHTVLEIKLCDNSIWYIDIGVLQRVTSQEGDINQLSVGPWVVTPKERTPTGWTPIDFPR